MIGEDRHTKKVRQFGAAVCWLVISSSMQAPGDVEQAGSISWLWPEPGFSRNLNQASVLLGLVFINCCLGFCVVGCSYICFIGTSQVIGPYGSVVIE